MASPLRSCWFWPYQAAASPASGLVQPKLPSRAVASGTIQLAAAKLASTELAAAIVTLHVSCVPEQAPLHPVNVDVAAGTAVRVIDWF